MNASPETTSPGNDFVRQLLALAKREDRGKLADLRRGLSPATAPQAWPVLGGMGTFRSNIPLPVFQTVAALFALHPKHASIGNIGVTCRHVAKGREEAFERRFRRLLACDTLNEVCDQLPGIVKMAKSADKLVDYECLFRDLRWFDHDPQKAKVAWARQYWGAGGKDSVNGKPEATE